MTFTIKICVFDTEKLDYEGWRRKENRNSFMDRYLHACALQKWEEKKQQIAPKINMIKIKWRHRWKFLYRFQKPQQQTKPATHYVKETKTPKSKSNPIFVQRLQRDRIHYVERKRYTFRLECSFFLSLGVFVDRLLLLLLFIFLHQHSGYAFAVFAMGSIRSQIRRIL